MSYLKISTRLKLLIGLLCLMMLGIGVLGVRGMAAANESLKSVYEDRTVALAQLSEVQRFNLQNQVIMANAASDSQPELADKYVAEMHENSAGLAKQWDDYIATYLTPDEKRWQTSSKTTVRLIRMPLLSRFRPPFWPRTKRKSAASSLM